MISTHHEESSGKRSPQPPAGERLRPQCLGKDYEITQPPPLNPLSARLERWRLQSVARRVLFEEKHTIEYCKRALVPLRSGVNVWNGEKGAYYTGLISCGSVWVCPICAAKISEGRRVDLVEANARWRKQGGNILLMNLTPRHYDFQPLREVLGHVTIARRLMKNRKPWKAWEKEVGLVGSVRGLEVTFGENGWHVHTHDLLYLENGKLSEDSEGRVLDMWQSACVSAGMVMPTERGCVIHDGRYADRYTSKWGLESEITKGHSKTGRNGNVSPWDMLRAIGGGNKEWPAKFREYAKGFHGRHQLQWSKGLRELLGLGAPVSDEDLAKTEPDGGEFLGLLGREQWRIIEKADKRGELLEAAHREGWPGVLKFITTLIENTERQGGNGGN